LFTIALRIVDKNDSSHKIDVEIEAYPANTPPEAIYNSIPEEYLISERQYYENNGQDQGSEDKLYAINFASLVIDPKFLEYDTLLIPDTFNSVIHNLGIGNYSEYARNVEHLVFVSNANTPFSFDAEGSFQDCTNFIDVIATGRDISHIRVNTFSGCTNLIKIVTSGFSNLSIGEFAFNGCYKFEGFDAPVDSIDITSIGSYAFNGCASLTFAGLNSIASVNGTEKIITPENAGIAFKPIDKLIPFFQKGCLISGHIDLSRPE
jgi:hypothetical protein